MVGAIAPAFFSKGQGARGRMILPFPQREALWQRS